VIIRQPALHRNYKRLITINGYEFIAHGRDPLMGKCKNSFYQIYVGKAGQTPRNKIDQEHPYIPHLKEGALRTF
jgi:hypothetical protein